MRDINDFQLTPNFNLKEFEDPSTHEVKISKSLVHELQYLRNEVGPLKITSGYRTKKHNKKVKGHKNSAHLFGRAVDVVRTRHTRCSLSDIAGRASILRFDRIIKYKSHIHLAIK